MPSLDSLDRLTSAGVNLLQGDSERYNRNDTLANAEDFDALFEVLSAFKDGKGRSPVFTALSLVANPDFQKIKESDFNEYHYEPITKTMERYGYPDTFKKWKEGEELNLFVPHFHGREHLNVSSWMRMLRKGDEPTVAAFNEGCWGFKNRIPKGIAYQAAFNVEVAEDLKFQAEAIKDGLQLFEQLHGRKATYFVPPNGFFNRTLEGPASEAGIKFMCAPKIQNEPLGELKYKKSFHYLGQTNKHGQKYITRNAFFEPNSPGRDWVDTCLKEIESSFKWRKPAVISTHRANFIGVHNPENRADSLSKLNDLLQKVQKKWPDVEFLTSAELGQKL